MGTIEGVEDHTELTEEVIAGMTIASAKSTLSAGQAKAALRMADALHTATVESQPQLAAWLLSVAPSGNSFIDSTVGTMHEKFFGNEDFKCAGRAKLGFGPSNDPDAHEFRCACRR